VLSVPTIDLSVARKNTVLTPSIDTVFQQIPDKKVKYFKRGIYIVREGEQMTGFYLIKVRQPLISAKKHPCCRKGYAL